MENILERGIGASEEVVAVTEARGSHGPGNWGETGREEFEFKSYFRSYVYSLVME